MPKRSLRQVLNQIETLQREADALRAREVKDVIARIQEAIQHYGLTPEELFSKGRRAKASPTAPAQKASRKRRAAGTPRYADPGGSGKTWTGQGKRPGWYVAALEGGKTAEDLLIK